MRSDETQYSACIRHSGQKSSSSNSGGHNYIDVCLGEMSWRIHLSAVELVGPKWRAVTGTLLAELYGMGFMILAGLGYLLRHRLPFYLAVSAPSMVCLLYLW